MQYTKLMDKIVEAYMEILIDNPQTEIPPEVMQYYFHRSAIDFMDNKNKQMLEKLYLDDQDDGTPCPKSRPIRMSTGGVAMER